MSERAPRNVPLTIWLGYWRAMMRYHRYEVHGLEHLTGGRAALIVGYHGRPLAYDQCMLTVAIHDALGYMPHGIVHSAARRLPVFRWFSGGLGFVAGDDGSLAEAIERGEHILVQPGGTREGCRSALHRYQVDWGRRTGYLRLAIKYGLPIVPVACAGVDDTYIGLNDGHRLARALNSPMGFPVWFGVGPQGLWPLSFPFPAKFRQLIGDPIEPTLNGRPVDVDDREALQRLSAHVQTEVQRLLNVARRL
ncbi:MAG: acyltransferase [Myxococcales bacterium]|nr:acyltransferase [Myxococcales bacterium]